MTMPKSIFDEMNMHLLQDERPSVYMNAVSGTELFSQYPLKLLNRLKETEQSPKYHPEGNAWNHTMLVLDEAAAIKMKSRDESVLMWAALLHDIGKPDTTRERHGRITSYGHDKKGAELAAQFLSGFTGDVEFIEKVTGLVRWHMQILFVLKGLPFADVKAMKRQSDIDEIALLGFCDRMGRLGADRHQEEANMKAFIQKCNK